MLILDTMHLMLTYILKVCFKCFMIHMWQFWKSSYYKLNNIMASSPFLTIPYIWLRVTGEWSWDEVNNSPATFDFGLAYPILFEYQQLYTLASQLTVSPSPHTADDNHQTHDHNQQNNQHSCTQASSHNNEDITPVAGCYGST